MTSAQLAGEVLAVVVVVIALTVMLSGALYMLGMVCSWISDKLWRDGILDRPNWEQDFIDRRK